MAKKEYKNAYTILEKVKKGEIKSYHKKDSDGLFGRVNFYKRPDLIKPYLHYMDEGNVQNIIKSSIIPHPGDPLNPYLNKELNKIPSGDDRNKFLKKLQDNYRNMPKHLMYDIYKMYYSKMDKMKFEDRDDKNFAKYKLLERSNNPVGKIMSETSELKSAVFTQSAIMNYLLQLTKLEMSDPEQKKQMEKCMNGKGEGDQKKQEKMVDKFLNSNTAKQSLEEAMKHAEETCKMIDENIPEETQKDIFNNPGGDGASKLSPEHLKEIAEDLKSLRFSMGGLKERLKNIMNKATSYFSAKKETKYEDLFNADDVSGLEDYILLHPKLRKIFAEDIQVRDTKSIGKISVYVDISGSMSGGVGTKVDGKQISCIDFAKSLVAKLKELDMLEELFLFNTSVRPRTTDLISIARIPCDGGTDIDKVIHHISERDTNSIVITDAGDSTGQYSDKAYFIGVSGSDFSGFRELERYRAGKQIVIFDGVNVSEVNSKGRASK